MERDKRPLVLIVDDTPVNVRLLAGVLDPHYDLAIASNGRQALEMAAETPPALVLLDVMMPDIDGYEVCRRLKASPATAGVPVIFLTAKSEPGDVVAGFQAGGVDYLSKPFLREELLSRVAVHVRIQDLMHELEAKNTELRHLAETDPLTGIANRRFLMARLEEAHGLALRHGLPFCLVMLDVDWFKRVNDRYGHLVGDQVLAGVAQAIRLCLRTTDSVGRYGGEEFLACLPHTDKPGALQVAEKIRQAVETLAWEVPGLQVTVSAGVACLSDGEDLLHQINCADAALYAAKAAGRNRVSATPVQEPAGGGE
jgi:diguanylate cyclase (GGDEF)-like protein